MQLKITDRTIDYLNKNACRYHGYRNRTGVKILRSKSITLSSPKDNCLQIGMQSWQHEFVVLSMASRYACLIADPPKWINIYGWALDGHNSGTRWRSPFTIEHRPTTQNSCWKHLFKTGPYLSAIHQHLSNVTCWMDNLITNMQEVLIQWCINAVPSTKTLAQN